MQPSDIHNGELTQAAYRMHESVLAALAAFPESPILATTALVALGNLAIGSGNQDASTGASIVRH